MSGRCQKKQPDKLQTTMTNDETQTADVKVDQARDYYYILNSGKRHARVDYWVAKFLRRMGYSVRKCDERIHVSELRRIARRELKAGNFDIYQQFTRCLAGRRLARGGCQ
jgi:hypothetical protein